MKTLLMKTVKKNTFLRFHLFKNINNLFSHPVEQDIENI